MEIMYGKMGTMTEDLVQHLKQAPNAGNDHCIGSVWLPQVVFYFARLAS